MSAFDRTNLAVKATAEERRAWPVIKRRSASEAARELSGRVAVMRALGAEVELSPYVKALLRLEGFDDGPKEKP